MYTFNSTLSEKKNFYLLSQVLIVKVAMSRVTRNDNIFVLSSGHVLKSNFFFFLFHIDRLMLKEKENSKNMLI